MKLSRAVLIERALASLEWAGFRRIGTLFSEQH